MSYDRDEVLGANNIPSGVTGGFFIYSVLDDKGICYADQNVIELFGCKDIAELRELTSNSFVGMVHPDDRERVMNTIKEYNSDWRKPHNYIRYRIVTKQGTYRYVEDFGHLMNSSTGSLYCYVFIAAMEQIEYESPERYSFVKLQSSGDLNVDSLTGLMNMDALYLMAKDMRSSNMADIPNSITVIVFDILGLRDVNKTLGHAEGDSRILELSKVISEHIPGSGRVFRGHEADIIAVCVNIGERDLMENIEAVVNECKSPILFGVSAAYSDDVSQNCFEGEQLLRALEEAQLDLRLKKMISTKSNLSQALTSLVRALEEVDSDTEAHVRRTQKMGIALGRRIGLSDLQLSQLQLLCLLHDIGKIAVPLEILNKPGKLNDDEWAVLRTHPVKGYQIATATEELKPLADPILYHHERWDGKGYPSGLVKKEIPVLSRIISIVDAYDAMVNDRCYRKGMSPDNAKKEISDCSGTQFDPYLASEFLAMLEEDPSLSYGTVTDGGEVRLFDNKVYHSSGVGLTKPVLYSKYKLDLDDTIIEVDGFFETLTGYSREDVVGKMTQFDLLPDEEREFYIEQVQLQFTTGNIAYLQHPIKRKDGTVMQVICNGERYFDSSVREFRSSIMVFEVT